jgi:hypothetical protein
VSETASPTNTALYANHIPDAVRRSSARADELHAEAAAAAVQGVQDDDGTADAPGDNAGDMGDIPAGAPDASVPGTSPPPTPAPTDWEQRYSTLQGKYNTEIAELRGQVRSLENLIGSMRTAPPAESMPAPTPQPSMPPGANHKIPEEDIEAYGEDLIKATQRWNEPLIERLETRIRQLEGNTHRIETRSAAQSVEQALDRAVPDWQQINIDPGFVTWLGQIDPFSGNSRKAMITDAHTRGDAARTIAFFQAFKNEQTLVDPPRGTQPNQTGGSSPPADRLPLESLAAPGRGPTTPPAPGAPDRRIWSGAEITQFYRRKGRGEWRGREADAERIEADIIAAGREGRVRQ